MIHNFWNYLCTVFYQFYWQHRFVLFMVSGIFKIGKGCTVSVEYVPIMGA